MSEPQVYCWGLKVPENRGEAQAYLRELYGAMDDLRRLGFDSCVRMEDKAVLVARAPVLTTNL